jgi:hypothetical protein
MTDIPPPPVSNEPGGMSPLGFPLPTGVPAVAPPPPRADMRGMTRGPVRLEPLGVGQTIDASIRLYRSCWKTLMVIAATILVPFQLLQQFLIHVTRHPVLIGGRVYQDQANLGVTSILLIVSFVILQPLMQASLTRAIAWIYLGEKVTARDAIRFALSKLGWVILAVFLAGLLTAVGAIALLIGAVFVYVRLYFVIPAVIIEDQKGSALSRSWRLTKGRWWHTFGATVLAGILAGIVSGILSIPSIAIAVGGGNGSFMWVVQAVLGSIATVIVAPFTVGVTVLLYFDARIRKEGFDLAVMAREVGATTP